MSIGEDQHLQHGMYCLGCGYSLRKLTASRCPECGLPFDRNDPKSYEWLANCPPFSRRRLVPWITGLTVAHGFVSMLVAVLSVLQAAAGGDELPWLTAIVMVVTFPAGPLMALYAWATGAFVGWTVAGVMLFFNSVGWATAITVVLEYRRVRRFRRIRMDTSRGD